MIHDTHPPYSVGAPRPWYRHPAFIVSAVLAGIVVIGCCGFLTLGALATNPEPEVSPTASASVTVAPSTPTQPSPSLSQRTAKPSAPGPVKIEDGVWTVGDDIPAGTYKVVTPLGGEMCYWSITKSGSNGSNIVDNGLPSGGRPTVVLKKGQDFETTGCGTWQKIK